MKRFQRHLAALLIGLGLNTTAHADTVTVTAPFSPAATTRFPTPLPSNSVGTTFTSYTGSSVPYIMGTFYVGTTGSFTGALSGIVVANGILFANGTFAPNNAMAPTTPLSNFLAGTQSGMPASLSVNLTAGQLYTYLLLFSSGSSGTATFTLNGSGCIRLGNTPCATFVPHGSVRSADVAALLACRCWVTTSRPPRSSAWCRCPRSP
jgi:hypothetical protein